MRDMEYYTIKKHKIRVIKTPTKQGFNVKVWVVNYSTSYISFRNREFYSDEEFLEVLEDYINKIGE